MKPSVGFGEYGLVMLKRGIEVMSLTFFFYKVYPCKVDGHKNYRTGLLNEMKNQGMDICLIISASKVSS